MIFRHVVFLKSFLYIYLFEYKNLWADAYYKENFKNHEPESCKKSKICLLIDNFNIVRWESLLSMSFTSITATMYFLFMALQNFAMKPFAWQLKQVRIEKVILCILFKLFPLFTLTDILASTCSNIAF